MNGRRPLHKWERESYPFEDNSEPTAAEIRQMELTAIQQLNETPPLPVSETVAEQIIRNMNRGIKVKAFIYAIFWLFTVPLSVATAIVIVHSIFFTIDWAIAAWWYAIAGGYLLMYGFFHNVQKRLYVAYALGFHGAKNALLKGWHGEEYAPSCEINDYYYKKKILKIWE